MADAHDKDQPANPKQHRTDAAATKVAHKAEGLAEKTDKKTGGEDKGPAGGFDDTPVPKAPPGWTVKITFHRATNLPFADINTLSSDPYILAQMNTKLPSRHRQDPKLRVRTPTIHKNLNPEWNYEWIVADVPSSGFELKARLYDEDPADHDDRLGNVHVHVHRVSDGWQGIKDQGYDIKKRMGSKRAYLFRGCAAMFNRSVKMSGQLFVSVELLGRTPGDSGGRIYTLGPCHWSQHFSPLFGRLVGTKDPEKGKDGKPQERYNFQANQIQLRGPVPEEMYHRFVEFRPFVAGMFTNRSLKGRILNHALHHQHRRIYNYDGTTVYGSFPEPTPEMTKKFLDLVHWDQGGRIFTYVITVGGIWRFTETGKEFGIDLLSKHTMHADCDNWIAYSGEFFVRRLKTPWTKKDPADQPEHPPQDISGGPPGDEPPSDPTYYHLVIDNDSGTYRPNKDLLPALRDYISQQLPGIKVSTLDCMGDADKMDRMKAEQRERHKTEGDNRTYAQADDGSSISSSDEEQMREEAGEGKDKGKGKGKDGKKTPGGKLGEVAHKVTEPKDAVVGWAQGDSDKQRRVEREEEEDMAETEKAGGGERSGEGNGEREGKGKEPETQQAEPAEMPA